MCGGSFDCPVFSVSCYADKSLQQAAELGRQRAQQKQGIINTLVHHGNHGPAGASHAHGQAAGGTDPTGQAIADGALQATGHASVRTTARINAHNAHANSIHHKKMGSSRRIIRKAQATNKQTEQAAAE